MAVGSAGAQNLNARIIEDTPQPHSPCTLEARGAWVPPSPAFPNSGAGPTGQRGGDWPGLLHQQDVAELLPQPTQRPGIRRPAEGHLAPGDACRAAVARPPPSATVSYAQSPRVGADPAQSRTDCRTWKSFFGFNATSPGVCTQHVPSPPLALCDLPPPAPSLSSLPRTAASPAVPGTTRPHRPHHGVGAPPPHPEAPNQPTQVPGQRARITLDTVLLSCSLTPALWRAARAHRALRQPGWTGSSLGLAGDLAPRAGRSPVPLSSHPGQLGQCLGLDWSLQGAHSQGRRWPHPQGLPFGVRGHRPLQQGWSFASHGSASSGQVLGTRRGPRHRRRRRLGGSQVGRGERKFKEQCDKALGEGWVPLTWSPQNLHGRGQDCCRPSSAGPLRS